MVAYYTKFESLWDALYGDIDIACGCICYGAPKLRARAANEQTHDFIFGLDDVQYGAIGTQILGMDPFPSLNRAYSLIT